MNKFKELSYKLQDVVQLNKLLEFKKNELNKKVALWLENDEMKLEDLVEDKIGWRKLSQLKKNGFESVLRMLLFKYYKKHNVNLILESFSHHNDSGLVFLLLNENELDEKAHQFIIENFMKVKEQELSLAFLLRKKGESDKTLFLFDNKLYLESSDEEPLELGEFEKVDSKIFNHEYFN